MEGEGQILKLISRTAESLNGESDEGMPILDTK